MKKILFGACLMALLPFTAYAADDCTTPGYQKRGLSETGVREYVWTVGVDTDGDADCSASATSDPIYGYIIEFKVLHESAIGTGGTSPASAYDLELRDADAFDWLFGEMATGATSETSSGNVDVPFTDAGGYPYLHGERLYPYIDSSNTAAFDITIYLRVKEK
jgi:hypothetical protein